MEAFKEFEPSNENTIEWVLKEKGVECPPVRLHMFFGTHSSAKDFDDFIASNPNPDMIIIENMGYNKDGGDLMVDDVTKGIRTPESMAPLCKGHPFYMQALTYSAEHGTPLVSVDIGIENPITEEIRLALESQAYSKLGSDLESSKQILNTSIYNLAVAQKKREAYITQNFTQRIAEAIEKRPTLLQKDALNLSMFYGAAHSGLYHKIRNNVDTTRSFQLEVLPFDSAFMQIMRTYLLTEKQPSDELVETALFESQIFKNKITERNMRSVAVLARQLKPFAEEYFEILFSEGEDRAKEFLISKIEK